MHIAHHAALPIPLQVLLAAPFVLAAAFYMSAAVLSRRKKRPWPVWRTALGMTGAAFAVLSVAGPLAEKAHHDFAFHMTGHLFLGMLAPLLMVLGAPATLALRSLPVRHARCLSRLMKSGWVRFVTHPVTAAVLNIGGLWLLYRTGLFILMHENSLLYFLIHLHVFLAGYVFTAAIIYIDPVPHPKPFLLRGLVLVAALAAHGILSKTIYAFPPEGVPQAQAEAGGMLMYYGGDAIDLFLIIIFCHQWYRAARPRSKQSSENRKNVPIPVK